MKTTSPILTTNFQEALLFASQHHNHQTRQGKVGEPYISHLMSVSSLVFRGGGNESEAIAALLHEVPPAQIPSKFGDNILTIVEELQNPILSMSGSAVRVCLADKLDDLTCFTNDRQLLTPIIYQNYLVIVSQFRQRVGELGTSAIKQYEQMRSLIINTAPSRNPIN